MSHLQPKFLTKAKTSFKQAKAPRSMPRNMIVDIACKSPYAKRKNKDPWFTMDGVYPPDHRIFSLKK